MNDTPIDHDILCPFCLIDLVELEQEGVEFNHCIHCRGLWVPSEELDKIARLIAAGRQARSQRRSWLPWRRSQPHSQSGPLKRLFEPR
ncbi:hypothetical protein A8V01_16595 [Novosphingobium guangzhouense]|uniref:Transcription factor zinc-finger domain-containing protein n=1 Tax=Novosphingobium guangzhouense TaxID=1850347 RepID=A0A2K2G2Z8_9SPHN|nr:hypothetical protein A8V01_16595 [Novosphingobium guangzhouense]